jgi:NAD(P)-dependent dehydrogenase (short-subunit alcohol dehydrogenase family)
MKEKTCLITGATSGLGKATALALAKKGMEVLIAGRDAERTETTAQWLKQKSGNPAVSFYLADLSSLASIRQLAAEVKRSHARLDVLVNNAGGIFAKREVTVDGFERTWATNHLAYFVLTQELLEPLKASRPARIVNVASIAHLDAVLDFGDLQGEKNYGAMRAYSLSKLANIMFTYALARRMQGTGVTANCLHPGLVGTNFGQQGGSWIKWLMTAARPFLTPPGRGAKTSIYLASSPKVEGVSGNYYEKCRAIKSSALSYDTALQERLWDVTEKMAGK